MKHRSKFLVFGSARLEEPEIRKVVKTLRSGWVGTGPTRIGNETVSIPLSAKIPNNDIDDVVDAVHACVE